MMVCLSVSYTYVAFTVSSIWILYDHDNQQAFYEQVMWIESSYFD